MGVYPLNTSVTITETFTVLGVPTDPTTVTYKVKDPEGTETSYVWTVAPEVTNPGVGIYVLELAPVTVPGPWLYQIIGTGAVEAAGSGEFTVMQSAIDPISVPFPQYGPCTPWIDGDDIQGFCTIPTDGSCDLDALALEASQIMFEVSGRQYAGNCERTVRPGDQNSTCWSNWIYSGVTWSWWWGGYEWGGWGWWDGNGMRCGCRPLSRVLLSGYPVTEIVEVKIDGVVLTPDTYRLDGWRHLTRMRDPAEPTIPQFWPACQILDLEDTEPGTWSVTYKSGMAPPLAGKDAAAALACELYAAKTGGACKLPSKAVRIVRQGLTIERLNSFAQMLLSGSTGVPAIDMFMGGYNPGKLRRRPSIWSPDGPDFAQRYGQ